MGRDMSWRHVTGRAKWESLDAEPDAAVIGPRRDARSLEARSSSLYLMPVL